MDNHSSCPTNRPSVAVLLSPSSDITEENSHDP